MNRFLLFLSFSSSVFLSACATGKGPAAPVGSWRAAEAPHRVVISTDANGRDRYQVPATGEAGFLRATGSGSWVSNGRLYDESAPDRIKIGDRGDRVSWRDLTGESEVELRRDRLSLTDQQVAADGATLRVRLYRPKDEGPQAGLVIVHGSGTASAVDTYSAGWLLAPEGFAVAVYDRRGTGASSGQYDHDFDTLADDAVAVARWLAAQPGVDPTRIALVGYSQGGWVAPLAASRWDGVAAVQVLYGMAESPAMEDRRQCRQALLGDADTTEPELEALVTAAQDVVRLQMRDGWTAFDGARAAAQGSAWHGRLDDAEGKCLAADLLAYPRFLVKAFGSDRLPQHLPWQHDAEAIIKSVEVPMHWMLAEQDSEAPSAHTASVLGELARTQPITVDVLSPAEHGMLTFDPSEPSRTATGYHADFFERQVSWLREVLAPR